MSDGTRGRTSVNLLKTGVAALAAGIAIWTTDQGDPPGVLEFTKNQARHVEVVGRHAKKAALE
jgi:hypothetical protein